MQLIIHRLVENTCTRIHGEVDSCLIPSLVISLSITEQSFSPTAISLSLLVLLLGWAIVYVALPF